MQQDSVLSSNVVIESSNTALLW